MKMSKNVFFSPLTNVCKLEHHHVDNFIKPRSFGLRLLMNVDSIPFLFSIFGIFDWNYEDEI